MKLTVINYSPTWNKQTKIGQMYKTIVFKTLGIKKRMTINPEKGKQIAQALNLLQIADMKEFVGYAIVGGEAVRSCGCPEPRKQSIQYR